MARTHKETKIGTKMVEARFRDSITQLADHLAEQFKAEKSLLANIFGVGGMGKSTFIKQVMCPKLEENEILPKTLAIPSQGDVSELAIDILDWASSSLLPLDKKIEASGLKNNRGKLEEAYSNFFAEINKQENEVSFGLLIDDLDNLPFDDLDWFQSVVLETISAIPQSAVIVTCHNELNWHSWELRNRCKRIRLEGFSFEEIKSICPSDILAQKIYQLSAGHPATVEALLETARNNYQDLSMVGDTELRRMDQSLLEKVKKHIDESLSARTDFKWLKEGFWLVAAADSFDTDLVNELVKEFEIKVPEDITDIAWEMSYTGLASWDFNDKTYKMVLELRDRIRQYMINFDKEQYIKALKVVAKAYQNRSGTFSNARKQMTVSKRYLGLARKIQMSGNTISIIPKKDGVKKSVPSQKDQALKIKRGAKMNKISFPNLKNPWSYVTRETQENIFKQFVNVELDNKWILSIVGKAGLGKSRLMEEFYSIAKKNNYPVVFVDLHDRKNRYREIFLLQIIRQIKIQNPEIKKLIKILVNPKKAEFTGITGKEFFEDALQRIAVLIASHLKQNIKNKRVVLFIDTLDVKEDPSIEYFESWLSSEFLPLLRDCAYVVVAGRSPLIANKDISENIEKMKLTRLERQFIHTLVTSRLKTIGLNQDLADNVERLSAGNPLISDWIIFYLKENDPGGEQLVGYETQEKALNFIAQKMWHSPKGTMMAFQAAVHFGSHFNLELFKAVIPNNKLGGKTHKDVFDEFKKSFYIRTTSVEKWTLHDDVRDRMLRNLSEARPLAVLVGFSRIALKRYYPQRTEKPDPKIPLGLEKLAERDDFVAQSYFHRLFVDSKSQHLALWNHLDDLWHNYRLDQMFHIIQFGREVQKWNAEASEKKDKVLTDLLNSAYAWMSYSADKFETAVKFAQKLINSPHRRLRATGNVVLGFVEQNPKKAILHLNRARKLYEQLRIELEENKRLKKNEFCDQIQDVYQELHMVLLESGKIRWQHFFNLNEGKSLLENALRLTASEIWKSKSSYVSMYEATALNQLARIDRFKGEFDEADKMARKAITIYKKRNVSDINLGRFYETLGLIKKADGKFDVANKQFAEATRIYDNIRVGSMEKYKATLNLEIGHLYFSTKNYDQANEYFNEAFKSLKKHQKSMLYYYLSALNKLGELQMKLFEPKKELSHLNKAKEYLSDQKKLSSKYQYELWYYWAVQNLQEIDYLENGLKNKKRIQKTLNDLLSKYNKRLRREFQPAFWETEHLLYKVEKESGNIPSALLHLAQGLAELAVSWSLRFKNNLDILSDELDSLDMKTKADQAQRLIHFWVQKFGHKDPAPEFIEKCKIFI